MGIHWRTPLAIACKCGTLFCLELLLASGADCNARCVARAMSPMGWAIECANVEAVRQLLAAGAQLNVGCTKGGVCPKAWCVHHLRQLEAKPTANPLISTKERKDGLIAIFDLLQEAEPAAPVDDTRPPASWPAVEEPTAASRTVFFFP